MPDDSSSSAADSGGRWWRGLRSLFVPEHEPSLRDQIEEVIEEHALRFEPESETGGLKPYLHVRRDLWAKVTRALFYDLVELGEERDIGGERM